MLSKPLAILLDCDIGEIRRAAEWLRAGCKDIDPICLGELELAVVEAVTNVVKHGDLLGHRNAIELELKRQADQIEIIIKDKGRPIPGAALLTSQMALDFDPDDVLNLPTKGIGLAIIREATDRFSYKSDDGVNTMSLAKNF